MRVNQKGSTKRSLGARKENTQRRFWRPNDIDAVKLPVNVYVESECEAEPLARKNNEK